MGFMSRRVLPICGNMCVCCPGLRSRSRQPVKRYKKLLADIFPKNLDDPPNERKITKLCEYAAKNPFRIAKYLEQRSYKELRSEHFKLMRVIMETYNKLLCLCKGQMPYFAANLLNVVNELLDYTRGDEMQILGCQTLTNFIYSQADGTYTHNIESLVCKICTLAREDGEGFDKKSLRAASLQCLSAMVWFMAEFSHIFSDFDEIVYVVLDNYGADTHHEGDEQGETHHNWVNEVVRCEARGNACVTNNISPSFDIIRSRPEKKDPFKLTRDEIEAPKVWSQICIQKMVELAKETTTMRRVLEPMFLYFDTRRHWLPKQGLAMLLLSDMCFLMESSGNDQLILAAIIRHLDHKNVAHDPRVKSSIIQIVTALAQQFRSRALVAEAGVVSDLCRHLRKSLQATDESVGLEESNANLSLQSSIEDCLLEISKRISDARLLFDMMAIALEKLPSVAVVARATVGSMLILAHIISLVSFQSYVQQVYPEALLLQLLKAMIHPDTETRLIAHRIFTVLLVPASIHARHDCMSLHMESVYEPRRLHSRTATIFSSASKLFEKLRREKEGPHVEKSGDGRDDSKDKEYADEEFKHGCIRRSSPNLYRISCSIVDIAASSPSPTDSEPTIVKLSEDQTAQLLSAFWMQSNLPDNLPSNFAAIAHSFSLTLLASRLKGSNHNVLRSFQLPLSLRTISLDSDGKLSPSHQRSLYTLATAMLISAAKIYHIPELIDFLKMSLGLNSMDPYISITDDLYIYVKPPADLKEYGTDSDENAALSLLSSLRMTESESGNALIDIIVRGVSDKMEVDANSLTTELSDIFVPDDTFLLGPQSLLDLGSCKTTAHTKESLSMDEDLPAHALIEDDVVSESSMCELPRSVAKSTSASLSQIISVGQLLESALEVAGHVASASVATSPLSYSTMASQCEALGFGTRKKLSSWLVQDPKVEFHSFSNDTQAMHSKDRCETDGQKDGLPQEPWQALRLPPASPFDNFLKAAGC
ncbi:EFR3-like protein [Nymphaea thermarum]|nr:EFR3-like protein [Nymphaea thermarum]